jgi:hypothetical protein
MALTDRWNRTPSLLGALLCAVSAVTLASCGAGIATTSVPSGSPTAATPSSTLVSSPIPNVTAAEQAALHLFVADPAIPGHWSPCSNSDNWAACPLSTSVKARLADLMSKGYFSDAGACGEEYISSSQNGMNNAPTVLSALAGSDGSVTVVVQRAPGRPNLTAVMAQQRGIWLASDLASGIGPAASVFSAKPNC